MEGISLSEMKRKNKEIGHYFFQRGNPSVVSKQGNYLVTRGMGNEGFVVFKYNPGNGHINLVDNPAGEYSWQPYNNKADAVNYAKELMRKN